MTSFASTNVEEEVQRVLRSAGLPSDPIDPSSMDALREMVREEQEKLQQQDDDRKPAAKPSPQEVAAGAAPYPPVAAAADGSRSRSRSQSPPPPRDASPPVGSVDRKMQRTLSDLTTPVMMSSSVSSTGGSSTGPEKRILEQLEIQSSLMLDMLRRIDDLTAKVDRLEGGGGVQPRSKRDRETTTTPQPEAQNNYLRYDEMAPPPRIEPVPPQAPRAVEQPVPPQPEAGGGFLAHLFLPILAPFNFLFQSRVALILRAFWTQRRGHVQPLDGGLVFKLIFMMYVVSSRVQRRHDEGLKSAKFISSIFLIVAGLLYHTKYLQYFYQFCFKDQVPLRIWNGEGADGRPMPPPQRIPVPPNRRPADDNDNNQDDNENLNWRQTFLGGIIIPRPNQNPIIAAVQDVFYLLGSFLFSIFPMWRPEGPQEPPPLIPLAPPVENNANVNADPEIPIVPPPRDAMEAADDDDDTDDERQ
jgi:hypothetical protein